jgi:hypothetical protein
VGNLNKRSERRKQMASAAGRLAVELALGTAAYLAWVNYFTPDV